MRQEKRNSQMELAVIDHIVNGTVKFPNRTIERALGRPTAHYSVIVSRLGIKTGMVTKIGEDMPNWEAGSSLSCYPFPSSHTLK